MAIACGLALGGCATFDRSEVVTSSLVSFAPLQASLFETSATVTLRLTSDAVRPLVFAGSSHRLFLNGTYVGRGVTNESVTVPPFAAAAPVVVIYLENLTLVRKFSEFQNAPPATIDYRLESEFHPAQGEPGGRVRTLTTGHLDVRSLMQAAAGMSRP